MLDGDARLGLGYNIDNDGEATGRDTLTGISRVRFGVLLTGRTASGVAFGAEVRADDAIGGEGSRIGQTEGSLFVSGALGTLSFGDTDAADAEHVGDLNQVGLTELGSQNETPFISNAGGFGEDQLEFAENPEARPTVRYDLAWRGFAASLSTNRDLTDLGLGGSWTGELGDGSLTIGVGYYRYAAFTTVTEPEPVTVLDTEGAPREVEAAGLGMQVPPGEQWSGTVGGELGAVNGKLVYSRADSEGEAGFETLGAGLGAGIGAWELNGYLIGIVSTSGSVGEFDGDVSSGLGCSFDLGGGALVQFGIVNTYADQTVADLGIAVAF